VLQAAAMAVRPATCTGRHAGEQKSAHHWQQQACCLYLSCAARAVTGHGGGQRS